mmetsp:Transcript_30672/g.34962  ORF Transcript_30672/g.34962 Transcript_30672/m.34962 type:complete len:183 (+) Transcript_30672:141-689(+)
MSGVVYLRYHQNDRQRFGANYRPEMIEVSPLFGRIIQYSLRWSRGFSNLFRNLVSIPLFSDEVLLQVSILFLCSEKVSIISEQLMASSLKNLNERSINGSENIKLVIPDWWIWALLAIAVLFVGIAVSSPYWCSLFPSIREETFMMIIPLFTMVLLEAGRLVYNDGIDVNCLVNVLYNFSFH